MEFNEKLQKLRKQKGLTQEELGEKLYVSRTAISKWESGRGYPNIESLKCIAKFFEVTVDELLLGRELLAVAEQDNKQRSNDFKDLIFILIDLSFALLFILPIFGQRINGVVYEVSLAKLTAVRIYVKVGFYFVTISSILIGALILILKNCQGKLWNKYKRLLSLTVNALSLAIFAIALQPNAFLLSFVYLLIKTLTIIKR